ncbi:MULTISPECIES: hypothetical protein [unclassified Rickettsia]|uniref:hypothetical protein n=1 Tax=unclassified Rickettsia TaxID=114295 RepID=UPI003132E95E
MTEFLPLYLNVRTVVGLTTVSRKTLIKRLDAVVKPSLLRGSNFRCHSRAGGNPVFFLSC